MTISVLTCCQPKIGASTLSIFMRMRLSLDVVRAAESIYVGSDDGQLKTYRDLSLVLRADHYANIRLSSGEGINKFDIDFTISTRWKTGKELDEDLTEEDIGFLFHTENNGKPRIHGGAIWPLGSFPEALGRPGTIGSVSILLSNVETIPEYAPPFEWGLNRPDILRINSIQLSVVRSTPQQEAED
jgi:hypothetical protein